MEVQLHSGVRVELRGSLKHQAGVESLLEGFEALRDMFVDEEKSRESRVVLDTQVGSVSDQ